MSLPAVSPHLPERLERVLCVGAHADDIEIGCAGTMLTLARRNPSLTVDWIVLSAFDERADEARSAAARVLAHAGTSDVRVEAFPERHFPSAVADLKHYFDDLGRRTSPDLVLCPRLRDMHQDHRTVAELVWQTFRSQTILEYEIMKFEGDLGRPNAFVELPGDVADEKIALLLDVFTSQHARDWFDDRTFRALLRLRGIECRAASGYAEAFHARKVRLW